MASTVTLLLWLIVLVVSWPLALLALVLYPFVWILLLPFRLAGSWWRGSSNSCAPSCGSRHARVLSFRFSMRLPSTGATGRWRERRWRLNR
jgi:hypothetical protein